MGTYTDALNNRTINLEEKMQLELDHLTPEELDLIIARAEAKKKEKEGYNGFKNIMNNFTMSSGDRFTYDASLNLLWKYNNKIHQWEKSRYQFLLDIANNKRSDGKPFVVKNIINYMIGILINIRDAMI